MTGHCCYARHVTVLREYEVIAIDFPTKFADRTFTAIRVADFVLVPVLVHPIRQLGVGHSRKTDKEPTGGDGGITICSLAISWAITKTSLQRSIETALQNYVLPALRAGTTLRVAHATTADQGHTEFEGSPQLPNKRWSRFEMRTEI